MSGLIFNWDDTAYEYFIYNKYGAGHRSKEDTLASVKEVIEQYRGSAITDFMMCLNARMASTYSKCWDSYLDKYSQKTENGREVDYTDSLIAVYHDTWEVNGIDKYAVWCERLKDMGINPWLSYRMNDAHCTFDDTSFLSGNYYYSHPELRRVTYREPAEYYDKLYDYSKPEVRRRFLDFIEETASRYDISGIELDWQREIFCFAPGGEYDGIQLITGFVREVRKILDSLEKVRGHKIRLAVRVPASPEVAYYAGFDAVTWAKEGLVDLVTPTPRWSSTDFDIPIELWRRILPENVTLAAGVEILVRENERYPTLTQTAETLFACSAQYFSAGADRLYLFNFMHFPGVECEAADFSDDSEYIKNLNIAGDPEKSIHSSRSHLISYRDAQPFWASSNEQVPRRIGKGTIPEKFRIRCGCVPEDMKATLILETDVNNPAAKIYVNSNPVQNLGNNRYSVITKSLSQVNTVEILCDGEEFTVKTIELAIE